MNPIAFNAVTWVCRQLNLRTYASVIKKELIRVPVIGIAMAFGGHLPVSRSGSRDAALKAAKQFKRILASGQDKTLYSEGTRRREPSTEHPVLKEFKKGMIRNAYDAVGESGGKIQLCFLGMVGSHSCWPPGFLLLIPGSRATLRFSNQFEFIAAECFDVFVERVRKGMLDNLSHNSAG